MSYTSSVFLRYLPPVLASDILANLRNKLILSLYAPVFRVPPHNRNHLSLLGILIFLPSHVSNASRLLSFLRASFTFSLKFSLLDSAFLPALASCLPIRISRSKYPGPQIPLLCIYHLKLKHLHPLNTLVYPVILRVRLPSNSLQCLVARDQCKLSSSQFALKLFNPPHYG